MAAVSATRQIAGIYDAHAGWLSGWLHRRTRCPERAQDLVQDTFCRILEIADEAEVRDPRNYLVTIARRLLIDDVRRREVERVYLETHALVCDQIETLTPDRVAEAVQMLDAVFKRLAGLPRKVRKGFVLIRLDGLSYAQAGEVLGVSDRMVKKYVAQAYAHFYSLAYAA